MLQVTTLYRNTSLAAQRCQTLKIQIIPIWPLKMFGQFYKLEDFEYICHCLFTFLSDFCSFFIYQFTGDMLIYKWNTWKDIVSTQSQKITLVPNFVRHKSVQLSSMALEIIAPCKSFTVNSRNHKTNWSVLPTPIPWQLHFFSISMQINILLKV